MNLERTPTVAEAASPHTAEQQWVCMVCGRVVDQAVGLPEDGIPPGTRFEDIADDWYCPDCGVTKADFEPLVF